LRIKQCKCITEVFNWTEVTNEKVLKVLPRNITAKPWEKHEEV
jgi:hypothetical protein